MQYHFFLQGKMLTTMYIFGLLIAQVVAFDKDANSSSYPSMFNSALDLNLDGQSSQFLCSNASSYDRGVIIHCKKEGPLLDFGYCVTYDEETKLLTIAGCPHFLPYGHSYYLSPSGQIVLPRNLSQLNDYMCGPLNRKGLVCSECADGFGPSVTSFGYKCANCTDASYGVPLFLVVEFVPITVFYLIILFFQISVTSAPMPCFVMYAQLMVAALRASIYSDIDASKIMFNKDRHLRLDMKIIHAIYGMFNLDFFRLFTPPFCISSHLKPIHIEMFGYISVLYPLFLIFLTLVCIELHGRNFRPLVWLWRPFHRCFVRLRRRWDTKSDIIDVFITFFLLSYSKCTDVTLHLMNYRIVRRYNESGHFYDLKDRTGVDFSVTYGSTNHLIFAIPAVILFCTYNVLLPLLLILYPLKLFQSCLSKCHLNFITVNIFVDKVHSCYRNGLEGGRDLRSFSGLYFFLRMTVYVISTLSHIFLKVNDNVWSIDEIWFPTGTVFIITALTIALIKPYRKNYMNNLDALLLFNIALCCFVMTSGIPVLAIIRVLFFTPIIALNLINFSRMFFKVSSFKQLKRKSYNLKCTFKRWLRLGQNSSLNLQGIADERNSIMSPSALERDYGTNT